MKSIKLLAVSAVLLGSASGAFAQGLINFFTFNNANGGTAFGRVYVDEAKTTLATGAAYTGQLYGSVTGAEGSFTAIGSAVALNQGVINAGNISVPGRAAGTSYFFQLWVNGNNLTGKSATFSAVLGGTSGSDLFTVPQANTFASFSLAPIPEPGVMSLAAIGGLGLLALRRKNA